MDSMSCEPRPPKGHYASNHACLRHLKTQHALRGLQASTAHETICLQTYMPRAPRETKHRLKALRASTTHGARCPPDMFAFNSSRQNMNCEACHPRQPRRQCVPNQTCLEHPMKDYGLRDQSNLDIPWGTMSQTMHASSTSRNKHGLNVLRASTTQGALCLKPCMPPTPQDTTCIERPASLDSP